jgi:translation elongation factor EF-Tu-like GTPase
MLIVKVIMINKNIKNNYNRILNTGNVGHVRHGETSLIEAIKIFTAKNNNIKMGN